MEGEERESRFLDWNGGGRERDAEQTCASRNRLTRLRPLISIKAALHAKSDKQINGIRTRFSSYVVIVHKLTQHRNYFVFWENYNFFFVCFSVMEIDEKC